jgi:hypothetical protein
LAALAGSVLGERHAVSLEQVHDFRIGLVVRLLEERRRGSCFGRDIFQQVFSGSGIGGVPVDKVDKFGGHCSVLLDWTGDWPLSTKLFSTWQGYPALRAVDNMKTIVAPNRKIPTQHRRSKKFSCYKEERSESGHRIAKKKHWAEEERWR